MDVQPLVIDAPAALSPWLEAWDALAGRAGRPYCSPGWMLPWWGHLRPQGARLHVALVVDGGTLLAVAPFFVHPGRAGRRDLRLLACEVSHGLDVLAAPDPPPETARVIAAALARARPWLVSFEGVSQSSPWPEALGRAWPGRLRPASATRSRLPAPALALGDLGYEGWLASQSRNFRQQLAQSGRRMEAQHGSVALAATTAEREAALAAFEHLHAERWSGRGGSSLPAGRTGAMLREAAARLDGEGRLRLWTLLVDGEVAAVQVFLAAGGEVSYWNGGWDERHARLRPALLTMAAAVEDAFARGDERLDLGGGTDQYKSRFADEPVTEAVLTRVLLPRGRRYPLVRLALLPRQARRQAIRSVRRLPEHRQQQVAAWVRRRRG